VPGQPAAFMSYVRFNDRHDDGRLTQFRERLSAEVRVQTGEEFPIFQDRNDIVWGQNWQRRIDQALGGVTLLLVIVTPSFFRSPACRAEVERFLAREHDLGRDDLILPVYYVRTLELEDPTLRATDELAQLIASRQYVDWRELRFKPLNSPIVRRAIAELASMIGDAFRRSPAYMTNDHDEAGPSPVPPNEPVEQATPAKVAPIEDEEPAQPVTPGQREELSKAPPTIGESGRVGSRFDAFHSPTVVKGHFLISSLRDPTAKIAGIAYNISLVLAAAWAVTLAILIVIHSITDFSVGYLIIAIGVLIAGSLVIPGTLYSFAYKLDEFAYRRDRYPWIETINGFILIRSADGYRAKIASVVYNFSLVAAVAWVGIVATETLIRSIYHFSVVYLIVAIFIMIGSALIPFVLYVGLDEYDWFES
jgi:hypothetical protein